MMVDHISSVTMIENNKGRDILGNKSQRQVSAISRVMCTASETSRYDLVFAYFAAAICRTKLKQFDFVRQIPATQFCRCDKDFCNYLPCHTRRLVAPTSARDMSLRFVASCVPTLRSRGEQE